VRYIVQRLRALCPMLGKVKIAEILARAGLHLGVTTVGRMLKEAPVAEPAPAPPLVKRKGAVTSKYPNHVWLVDLTTVSIGSGFWVPWSPFSLLQCWPFCWWVSVVIDHYSRRVMGITVFREQPSSVAMRAFIGRVMRVAGATPKHMVSDKGAQFWCDGFRGWCARRNIKPRFEPLCRWTRSSPCAKPVTLVTGPAGVGLEMEVGLLAGRKHLPVVRLQCAA